MVPINRHQLNLLQWKNLLYVYSYEYYRRTYMNKQQQEKTRERRFWVREIYEEREEKGEFNKLVKQMMDHDPEYFRSCFRMSPEKFYELLALIRQDITKKSTKLREPISAEERLAVTLRYITTGDAHKTIAASYRMSPTTVGRIIPETCRAIWQRLCEAGYLNAPNTEQEWIDIANGFGERWNFPNCVGAIDGKHINMFCPPKGGSAFYNYKGHHSIVLMAVCDSKYRFIMVDIGDYGRQSDGSVYHAGHIGPAIENNLLHIPPDRMLPYSDKVLPFVFVGDDAFGLKRNMMKPYPFSNLGVEKLIFNYRLSRARRIIENTFGIMASKFRIFYRLIDASVDTIIEITRAAVVLHNFLIDEKNFAPNPTEETHGELNIDHSPLFKDVRMNVSNNYTESAKLVRDGYKDYFNREGYVSWQWERVNRI